MTFIVQEGGQPIAQVEGAPTARIHVHKREQPPPGRLPARPLHIPPAGFIRITPEEARIFGLAP